METAHRSTSKEVVWQRLKELADRTRSRHLSTLFAQQQSRFRAFSCRVGPLLLDFSKQRMEVDTLQSLAELADASELRRWIGALFAGESVNNTEDRAAMHWALRLPSDDRKPVNRAVQAELDKMAVIVARLHAGQWRGFSGEPITNVVNIGVGGSDLGPLMVSHALGEMACGDALDVHLHFVSSMDGSQLSQLLSELRPQNTLFVVSSKSFTTVDTLSNAATARSWLTSRFGAHPAVIACHFIGVSASPEKMSAWGIPDSGQLQLWDWVGGRFSLWSAIGLTIAIRIGMDKFRELLAGAHFMDKHFCEAPWLENLPVLLALIGVWNGNFLSINAHAVLPYDGRLRYLPGYLSQLEMESNGKSVSRDGLPLEHGTCPILWGEVGPNAQHAFYQLLHQGTQPVSSDFIVPIRRYHNGVGHDQAEQLTGQHLLTLANCLAQSRLLAFGEAALPTDEQMPLYRRYHGNQPSSTLLLDEITPFSVGALLALYEHKVFAQAVIWGINPFDQWGVEMGKRIAGETLELMQGRGVPTVMDASTEGLMAAVLEGMSTAAPGVD